MQPDNNVSTESVSDQVTTAEPDPVDAAEERSERAWEKADAAVEDLKKLGHEDDEGATE